jgi:hypothetical protein
MLALGRVARDQRLVFPESGGLWDWGAVVTTGSVIDSQEAARVPRIGKRRRRGGLASLTLFSVRLAGEGQHVAVCFRGRATASPMQPTIKRTSPMNKLLVTAVSLALSFQVAAATRCTTDSFGNTTCRDAQGNTSRSSTDSFGNTTTRYSDGTTSRATTDTFGNTTLRHSDGRTSRATTDTFGNTTIRQSDGTTSRATTDSFGNTTINRSNGSTVRCTTDTFGNTTCR